MTSMTYSDPTVEASVQKASLQDTDEIYALLAYYSQQEILLPRSRADVCRNIRDFRIVKEDNQIVACGALLIYTDSLAEIRSLAVSEQIKSRGYGRAIVNTLELEARQLGLKKVMALTYATDFFSKLGYQIVDMDVLPEKVWGACINCPKFNQCDEIAVLKYL